MVADAAADRRCAGEAGAVALAAAPASTAGGSDPGSSRDLAGAGRYGFSGSRNVGIVQPAVSSLQSPERPALPESIRRSAPIGPRPSARTRVAGTGRGTPHAPRPGDVRARLEFSLGDLLHDLDLDALQAFHIHRLKRAETFAPSVDRRLRHAVLLGDRRDGTAVGFPQDANHLLISESGLLHGLSLVSGNQNLKHHMVRFSTGRSVPLSANR